ncbi:hypothetical protein MUK42_27438 [Musa troglodytarum]|uniref:Uncharacterized protein n=1 Tax=Musa troglodytarum TaxID=320322 RepID=A0A9E7G8A2_9LILI|nr:hypothetical protein MUK42_27438 [Musa troglodytarum]
MASGIGFAEFRRADKKLQVAGQGGIRTRWKIGIKRLLECWRDRVEKLLPTSIFVKVAPQEYEGDFDIAGTSAY